MVGNASGGWYIGGTGTGVGDDSGATYVQVICPYCGASHQMAGVCPRVEEMEYYPDGAVKRVKFREPVQEIAITTTTCPERDQNGHICGVDCPQSVWGSR